MRDSDDLIIFLHGLGLDANDFRPYMAESRFHCLALTLFGLNVYEKDDEHYAPISLRSHVQLMGYGLTRIRALYPKKCMTIVSFSFGADMVLLLTQYAPEVLDSLKIHEMVLLDQNINRATTTISSRISKIQADAPMSSLIELLGSATTLQEFRYLCEYLYKIISKDFEQIQMHARDMVGMWAVDSPDQFLDYLGKLTYVADGVHVVLSFNFQQLFNSVAHGAITRGLDANALECSRADHFELINAGFLKDHLEGLL
jgi:pimeloyl-ACP methyl ester carboxylesterase